MARYSYAVPPVTAHMAQGCRNTVKAIQMFFDRIIGGNARILFLRPMLMQDGQLREAY